MKVKRQNRTWAILLGSWILFALIGGTVLNESGGFRPVYGQTADAAESGRADLPAETKTAEGGSAGPSERNSTEGEKTGGVIDLAEVPDEKLPNKIVDPNILSEDGSGIDPAAIQADRQMKGPKQLVSFFLDAASSQDYKSAAMGMDFSKHPELTPIEREDYAFKLAGILYRLDHFSLEEIPESFDKPKCGIWPDRNFKPIILERQKTGTWRVSPETVDDIPRLFDQIESKPPVFIHPPWMERLPQWVFTEVFHLTLFQWGKLAVFIILGWLVYKISPQLISRLTFFMMRFHGNEVYSDLLNRALRPLAYFGMLWVWFYGLHFIQVSPKVLGIVIKILQPICVVIVMISFLRFVDIFHKWLQLKITGPTNKIRGVLIDLATGLLKFLVICLAAIRIVQIFGFSALGIVSGMGIGGIAVALAAQQTISNFFGSLTILMDQPFTIGDYILVNNIEGIVESVGLRSTRIRTFYDSCVFIPNGELATSVIDNMGHRTSRRFKTTLGLQYDTPVPLLRAFCSGVQTILENHPRVRKDDIRVSVYDLNASSIDINLVCFLVVRDIQSEIKIREELIFDILLFARKLGVSFAFPTQTNYMIESRDLDYPAAEKAATPEEAARLGQESAETILWPEQKPNE